MEKPTTKTKVAALKFLLAPAAVAFAMAPTAHAALVSVDLNTSYEASVVTSTSTTGLYHGDINASGQNSTNDPIGVWGNAAPAANWWNYGGTSAAANIIDADGNATTITYTVTYLTALPNEAHNWDTGTPSDDLVNDGYYLPSGKSITTTIAGLSANTAVQLIVYHADGNPSETVTVNSTTPVDYTGSMLNTYADASDSPSDLPDSDFWYFKVTTDSSGQLVISSGGTNYNTICGFQILTAESIPTPASLPAGLALLGLTAVASRRRKTH